VASLFDDAWPRCGAKTRAGAPCKRMPCTGRTRCNLHGGKSLSGVASRQWKHGYYSKTYWDVVVRQMVDERIAYDRAAAWYAGLSEEGKAGARRDQDKRLAPLLRKFRQARAAKRYREWKKQQNAEREGIVV